MSASLATAFEAASPRVSPKGTPLASVLIHGLVLLVWFALLLAAWGASGLWVWAVGVAYMSYDTALQMLTVWSTWRLCQNHGTESGGTTAVAPGEGLRVGIIVAAYNEARVLPATIAGLMAQSRPPDQIVIADDGSSDDTAAVLRDCHGLHSSGVGRLSAPSPRLPVLHWLPLAHGGKARALNAAVVQMKVDIVLTVDADTVLEPDALAALCAAFERDRHLVAATGVLTPVCRRDLVGRVLEWFQTYEYLRNFLARYAWMRADGLLLISGAFAGFRREAVVAVGGFDPTSLVEDYELIHRLRRHASLNGLDWRTQVVGQARARTEAPSTLATFLRQRRRWFGGFLQTQFWYRDMVGNARFGRVGTRMLPVKAVDTLQPLFGLAAWGIIVACLLRGRWGVLLPVATLMGSKALVDLAFHGWAVHVYRRWVGQDARVRTPQALLASLVEPFSFQVLRHLAAALGWVHFVTGRMRWGRQHRVGMGR